MELEVHLYGKLRRFTENTDPRRQSVIRVSVARGETIRRILERNGIPVAEVGTNIFLNGEYSSIDRVVEKGGRLGVFPDDMNLLYKWHFDKKG
jgi:hypothetical protein